jgi:SAM-dependent methyltransferase
MIRQRLFFRTVKSALQADIHLRQGLGMAHRFAQGLLDAGLKVSEKEKLGTLVYTDTGMFWGDALFPREEAIFQKHLPPSPAHILVGGCGTGRELAALLSAGHRVTAYEPGPALLAKARSRFPEVKSLALGSHQDFSSAVLDRRKNGLEGLTQATYDAVIFGWWSLSHLLSPEERRRALKAAHAVCPHGPLVLSFDPEDLGARASRRQGRAYQMGKQLAHLRFRGLDRNQTKEPDPNIHLGESTGYYASLELEELRAVAGELERRLIDEGGEEKYGSAYAVMVKG